jgi:hypothetical protein
MDLHTPPHDSNTNINNTEKGPRADHKGLEIGQMELFDADSVVTLFS